MMRDYRKPIVILPATMTRSLPIRFIGGVDSQKFPMSDLGLNVDQAVMFSEFELEIWGEPIPTMPTCRRSRTPDRDPPGGNSPPPTVIMSTKQETRTG